MQILRANPANSNQKSGGDQARPDRRGSVWEKKKNYHRIERFEGQFYREIPLPRGVDPDKIQATSAKGVLMVTIPKKAEAQPKKITVQAEK